MGRTLGGGSVAIVTGQVILLGATGFTGRLTAEAMTRAGLAPVLAGRSADALVALTGDVAGLGPIDAPPTWRTADVTDPASVRALVTSPDDVLVSTVGPFTRLGGPAVEAAVEQGCAYIDSTGEPPFIRSVFEKYGPRAEATGARLLTAFGYDYVPGNLAAAHAIADARAAGRVPVIVEIGYFIDGTLAISSGTRASAAVMAAATPFALRNGRIVDHAGSVTRFDVAGRQLDAMPVSGSEHFTLTRLDPGVRDVGVYLGWAGRWTRAAHAAGGVLSLGSRVPLLGGAIRAGVGKATGSATGEGPSAAKRASARSVAVARTLDGVGRQLSHVRVEGPSPYDLTADLLAWGAAMMLTGHATAAGALGPVDAFGFEALVDGCADLGLRRVD
jgi:short subunit dehydrogenase-like uncharacterized protein